MPDYTARERLKQKVLERWEYEGGKVEGLTKADESNPTRDHESEGNQLSPSH